MHWVLHRALRDLKAWVERGRAPASAPRLQVDGSTTPPTIVRDELGNALGGIRTPAVDVPIATLTGDRVNTPAFCVLFGATFRFDEARLRSLYPSHGDYLAKVVESALAAVDAGFLLPEDALAIIADAARSDIGRYGDRDDDEEDDEDDDDDR